MRATLQFLVGSDIPADHKAVLMDTLTEAMRRVEDAHVRRETAGETSSQWHGDEIAKLQTFLQGKSRK